MIMMKRVFILMMSISAVFMGCSKANEPQGDAGWDGNTEPKENLVVMSYNIKHCAPYYGVSGETTTADVNNVANVIKKQKARCSFVARGRLKRQEVWVWIRLKNWQNWPVIRIIIFSNKKIFRAGLMVQLSFLLFK